MPHPNTSCCLVGLWVDDFADWGGLYVLNSQHTGPTHHHPPPLPGAQPTTDEAAFTPRNQGTEAPLHSKKV
jgi:hypothetical protein